jgi:hypothetical protein
MATKLTGQAATEPSRGSQTTAVNPCGPAGHAVQSLIHFDAISFVNETLWRPGETAHANFRMFDSITVENGAIASWLFESSEGLIKSKSKSRWNADGVIERCFANSNPGKLVLYSTDAIHWRALSADITNAYLSRSSNDVASKVVMVSAAHLEQYIGSSPTYIEQTFDPMATRSGRKNLTSILSNPAGKIEKKLQNTNASFSTMTNNIPQHKVTCKNREICNLCTSFSDAFIKLIESRKPIKVVSMSIVVVVENDSYNVSIGEIPPLRRVWLHHVRSIAYYISKAEVGDIGDSPTTKKTTPWETRSSTSSTITLGSQNFTRPVKCSGDFCLFNDLDEIKTMQMLATESRSSLSNRLEIAKAKQRHRRLTVEEVTRTEELVGTSFSAEINAAAALSNDEIGSAEDGTDFDANEDRLGPLPQPNTAAHHIPYKSVALARQDMNTIEGISKSVTCGAENELTVLTEAVPWSERLVHWWLRMGKSLTGGVVRQGLVPLSAADKISTAILSGKCMGASEIYNADGDTVNSCNSAVPYDLSENAYASENISAKKKAGLISWYYSDCTICERCFNVYKEIDARRKSCVSTQFKARREEQDKRDVELGRTIEKRIFAQRKAATRLAKSLAPRIEKLPVSETSRRTSSSDGFIPDQQQIGDWCESVDDTNSFVSSLHNSSFLNANSSGSLLLSTNLKAPAPVSKAILPPLPWQLNDKASRDVYEQSGSAFIRNLGKKTQQATEEIANDKMIANYQNIARANGITVGNIGIAGLADDWTEDWKKATGQLPPLQPVAALSGASGPILSVKRKKATVETTPATFNAERLLHPYQRGLQKLREDLRTDEEKKLIAQLTPSNAVKILIEKKNVAKSVLIPKRTKDLIARNVMVSGNPHVGMGRSASVPLHLQLMQQRGESGTDPRVPMFHNSKMLELAATRPRSRARLTSGVIDAVDVADQGVGAFSASGVSLFGLVTSNSLSPDSSSTTSLSSPSKSLRKQVSFGNLAGLKSVVYNPGEDIDGDMHRDNCSSFINHGAETGGPRSSPLPPKVRSLLGNVDNVNNASAHVKKPKSPEKQRHRQPGDEDGDDDDDDDEAIGWSPFVIPVT